MQAKGMLDRVNVPLDPNVFVAGFESAVRVGLQAVTESNVSADEIRKRTISAFSRSVFHAHGDKAAAVEPYLYRYMLLIALLKDRGSAHPELQRHLQVRDGRVFYREALLRAAAVTPMPPLPQADLLSFDLMELIAAADGIAGLVVAQPPLPALH